MTPGQAMALLDDVVAVVPDPKDATDRTPLAPVSR